MLMLDQFNTTNSKQIITIISDNVVKLPALLCIDFVTTISETFPDPSHTDR